MSDTITLPRFVVQEAAEALEFAERNHGGVYTQEIANIRAALAAEQPKQEPVAWQERHLFPGMGEWTNWYDHQRPRLAHHPLEEVHDRVRYQFRPLYAAPPDSEAMRRDAERLREELEEDAGVIAVWRGRTERAEAENERLREALGKVADASMSMHLNAAHMATSLQGIAKAALRREEVKP